MSAEKIAELNDKARSFLGGAKWMLTPGVSGLSLFKQTQLMAMIVRYDDFGENDPYGEHDFGAVELDGEKYFWKIDYYDKNLEFGSEDPSDPEKTQRVLTVMRADEY